MNERMYELINQCFIGTSDGKLSELNTVANVEKFAETLIRECANVLDPNGEYTEKYKHSHTPGPDGLRQVLSQEQYFEMLASKKLKEHFGVG